LRYSSVNRGFPAGNPLANVLVIVVGAIVIAASLVLGFFVFVILGSAILMLAAIFGVRLWWMRHRIAKTAGRAMPDGQPRAATRETIEGEYRVVIRESDREPPGTA
jgi:hypothetical protein